jgi:hypothetical protein
MFAGDRAAGKPGARNAARFVLGVLAKRMRYRQGCPPLRDA